MFEKFEQFSSSALFLLLCGEAPQLKSYAFNKEISKKLQSFFDSKFPSLDHTNISVSSIQSCIQENFPKEIRNKILILVELVHRTYSNKKNPVSNQSKTPYQEILQFPQIQEDDDLLKVALIDDYNNLLWCKKVYSIINEKKIFELKISNIFSKAFKLDAQNILLFQKVQNSKKLIPTDNLKFARKIQEACNLLNLCFLDYILITSDKGHKSLKKIGIF